jgi:hypothetical protein
MQHLELGLIRLRDGTLGGNHRVHRRQERGVSVEPPLCMGEGGDQKNTGKPG